MFFETVVYIYYVLFIYMTSASTIFRMCSKVFHVECLLYLLFVYVHNSGALSKNCLIKNHRFDRLSIDSNFECNRFYNLHSPTNVSNFFCSSVNFDIPNNRNLVRTSLCVGPVHCWVVGKTVDLPLKLLKFKLP